VQKRLRAGGQAGDKVRRAVAGQPEQHLRDMVGLRRRSEERGFRGAVQAVLDPRAREHRHHGVAQKV